MTRRSQRGSRRRRIGPFFLAATLVVAALPARAAITSPTAAYLTLLFGRAQWVSTDSSCTPTPGAMTLQDIATALHTRGLTGSGTVVLDRIAETTRLCQGVDQQASWADLSNLQANDGWRFVSQGLTETDVTQLSLSQQQADICGSLPAFNNHGMIGSNGLFAYAGNGHNTTTVQTNVTQTCFDFGRQYSSHTAATPGSNSFSTTGPPWFQQTMSVIGGQCNDPALPCYTAPVKNNRRSDRYTTLVQAFSPSSGQWNSVQIYRLVIGASSTGADTWDCTPANPDDRWTSIPEEYCASTYFAALDQALAAHPGVIAADPASVATAWGRSVVGATAPGAPANVTATAGDSKANVSWTAPGDGGNQITSYTVTASPGPATAIVNGTPPATTAIVSGLTNGTAYTFTVTATNNVGSGPASNPSAPVTPTATTAPGAPTNVRASRGPGHSANVSWTAPTSDGGSPINGYTVTSSPGGLQVTVNGTTTSAPVTGLTRGVTYTFAVVATNINGPGPPSVPSNPVKAR